MKKYSTARVAVLIIGVLSISLLSFKYQDDNCESIRNGIFHFYKNNDQYHAIVIKKDSLQTEINTNTYDTSYWRLAWVSSCEFTATFV